MNKLDKLNQLVYEYQCQLADAEASGKGFKEVSKLLNDTIEKRKDYIAELTNRDEPMKPLLKDMGFEHYDIYCPSCKEYIGYRNSVREPLTLKYCPDCGQKLDLENENEK